MRVAGHQPTFLPYLGFWSKALASDVFVLLPDYQFSYNGSEAFIHRCLIEHGKRQYMTIPIERGHFPMAISEVRIKRNLMDERWAWLERRFSKTPFWSQFSGALRSIWNAPHATIDTLNIEAINWLAGVLNMPCRFVVRKGFPDGTTATEKIQSFCDEFGATLYISGSGGRRYMDMSKMRTPTMFNAPEIPVPYQTTSVLLPLLEKGPEWTRDVLSKSIKLSSYNGVKEGT